MGLKEKLSYFIQDFFIPSLTDRDYEFEANLENHPLGMQNVYRLHYIDYHRIGERYGMGPNNVGRIDYSFKPFMLPVGMSREDAFKVLSYLTDYIEKQFEVDPCSQKSVETLNDVLDLERLGFTRLNIYVDQIETDIIDLFTVTGRLLLFKQSEYYSKYFEWYTENVTLEEVSNIYDQCGIEFYDLIAEKSQGKLLEKIHRKDKY